MKLKKFNYLKEEKKDERNVLQFHESDKYIEGIDLSKLKENEKEELLSIQREYEQNIEPYIYAYRKFLKEKIEWQ